MTEERLFPPQRHERLLTELRRHGAVRVRELARDLGVSELTIRRDITALAARNLVTRVHGGATLPRRARPSRPRAAATAGFAIGMVVPSLDLSWPPVVTGARAAAAALGVTIQLYAAGEDRRQITALVEDGEVRGLLLAPDPGDDDTIDWIARLPVPAVLVERQPRRRTAVDWVRSDHELGLEIAVQHLREQGHRRIGLLLARGSHAASGLRHPGLMPVLLDDPPRRAIAGAIEGLRRQGVTAIVAHGDTHPGAVAQTCAEQGLRIPEDLALMAYDDELAHLADPPLTAVRPPKNHVGRLAVELILARLLDGDHRPIQGVLVAPSLVVRQSSFACERM